MGNNHKKIFKERETQRERDRDRETETETDREGDGEQVEENCRSQGSKFPLAPKIVFQIASSTKEQLNMDSWAMSFLLLLILSDLTVIHGKRKPLSV